MGDDTKKQWTLEDLTIHDLSTWEQRALRLHDNYLTEGQVLSILRIQKGLETYRYSDDFLPLFAAIDDNGWVRYNTKRMWNRWKKKRFSLADFEGVFWDAILELADGKYNWTGEYFFFETMKLACRRRAIDFTRNTQRMFEGKALQLLAKYDEPDPKVNVEEQVITKILLEEALRSLLLTEEERSLVLLVLAEPRDTYRELAQHLGKKHPQEITRMFRRIGMKIGPMLSEAIRRT